VSIDKIELMRKIFPYVLALLASYTLGGCYPHGPEYDTDFDLVYTAYSPDFAFSGAKTFALPDSVVKITGDALQAGEKPQFVAATYSDAILAQLRKNLEAYGWTEVDKNGEPDVIILPTTTTTTNLFYYYDWGYWGWWYPGYPGGGWGWYYPGYYPPYVTGYRSGSVFVQMVDNKSTPGSGGGNVSVVWNCILNGLAEGSSTSILGRIQSNLDQAFVQSPYLKH
jgi:hypothetical protein